MMKLRTIKLIVFIIVGGVILYLVFPKMKKQGPTETNLPTLQPSVTPTILSSPGPTQQPAVRLQGVVEEKLEGVEGTYGVVVKNLKTGESYSANGHREFEPASLYKLWIMAEVYNQIQNERLKEDEILSEDIQVLNNEFNIDPEFAELTDGTITLSVKDALEQMIANSDNYAALLLTEKVKLSNVKKYLDDHGFNESVLGEPPKTTPYDIALFFEKLYNGKLANPQYSRKMMDILKRQTLNDKLPKYLPENVTIAHKTGEIGSFTHDAGIVFSNKGDYVIVVMSESESPPGAEERIVDISKAVYEYFGRR